jgi:hypothetical protein
MMHLTEPLSQRFEQELRELEETLNMPYVTSVERIAEARGGVSLLLRQLGKVCGRLPEDVADRIRSLPFPQIEALGEALLGFQSLSDLQNWLDLNEGPAE